MVYDRVLKCWFISLYHLSFPIPNIIAKEICLKISLIEKKNNIEILNKFADDIANELLQEEENNKNKKNDNKNNSNDNIKYKKKNVKNK